MLIAALLELKSRLMLPGEESRSSTSSRPPRPPRSCSSGCSRYARFRGAGGYLAARARGRAGVPLPLRAAARRAAPRCRSSTPSRPTTRPCSAQALGGLLRTPPPIDLRHMAMPRVSLADRLARAARAAAPRRVLLRRGGRGADRMTVAVTLFALLELYKRGEAALGAGGAVRADHGRASAGGDRGGGG